MTIVFKRAKSTYHKIMYAYNYILYRDCLDIQMKEQFHIKVKKHEKGIK